MTAAPPGGLAPDVQALAADYPEYVAALARNRRWNFGANVLDSSLFALTSAALTETTILPYFVSQLTANALVIGLSPAIAWLGQFLPQLFGAYLVHSRTRRKPYIIRMAWLQRGAILLMLLIALTIGRWPNGLALGAFLLAYFAFWSMIGLIIPAYANFYAKHIPSGRGSFLGVQAVIYGGLGVVSAGVVQRLLTGAAFPMNFVQVLAYALLSALPAMLAFYSLREVTFPIQPPRKSLRQYLRDTGPALRARPAFGRFLAVRAVMVLGKMTVPFLALYALQRYRLGPGLIATYTGVMLAAQSVSALGWGYLSDRWPPQAVWGAAALVQVLFTSLALWAPAPGWFLVIFALIGVLLGAEATAQPHTTYLLSPAEETTRFIGLTNSSLGPLVALGPLAAGALIRWYSYPVALAASAGLAAAGLLAVGVWAVLERSQTVRLGGTHA